MAQKKDVQVIIDEKVITLSADESIEYMQKVALYINNKKTECKMSEQYHKLTPDYQALLLSLNIADGTSCTFGGYALDEYDKETKKRYCPAYSMELITRIMKAVGVSRWEDLKGKYIRVVSNGRSSIIKKIGNLMKNDWFDIDAFFKEYEI